MKDLKILNASFPDFESGCLKTADLLIHQGTIEKIGCISENARLTIDAAGKVLSPGFIDMHTHEDKITEGRFRYLAALCQLRMGVTTGIAGNCGENSNNFSDFYYYVKKHGSPINYMMFTGQNWLRSRSGADNRYAPSTKSQLEQQKKLLSDTLQYGTAGLSCGLEYTPGITTEETIELLSVLDDDDFLTSVHFRKDGAGSVSSIEELLEISRKSSIPIQMSHIGSCSATGYMDDAIACLRKAREQGIDITADCYPYDAFCTSIGTAVFDEGCFERFGKSYDAIFVPGGAFKNQRCTKEIFEKIRKETPELPVIAFVMNEDEVIRAFQEPFVMVGSDCGFEAGSGHPRSAGTYPRILGRYVREKKVLTLINALDKMTRLPAQRMHLQRKGEIKEGFDADLVIFDPDTVADCADFENTALPPKGIDYVIIDGAVAVKNNLVLQSSAGKYLDRKGNVM